MTNLVLMSLALQLGSPVFAERELATAMLGKISPEAYLVWASKHRDAEIAARSRKLLDEYYWKVSGELLPTNYPYQPWVDSLKYDPCDRTQEINNYLSMVNTKPGQDAPYWGKYRLATRYFIFHLLKRGQSKIQVIRLLDDMAAYEKNWILRHKGHYKFSPEILEAAGK